MGSSVPEQTWYEEKNYEVFQFFSTSEDLSFHEIFFFSLSAVRTPSQEKVIYEVFSMSLRKCISIPRPVILR